MSLPKPKNRASSFRTTRFFRTQTVAENVGFGLSTLPEQDAAGASIGNSI